MTWEPAKSRWRKMYRGKVYTVTCEALGARATKEGSCRLADAWWRRKLAELAVDGPHPHADVLAELGKRLDWAVRHGAERDAAEIRERIATVRRSDDREEIEVDEYPDVSGLMRLGLVGPNADPHAVRYVHGGGKLWADRLRHDRAAVAPAERTVGGRAAAWIESQRDRVRAGGLSPGAWDNLRRDAERFRDFAGASLDVAGINEAVVQAYHAYLLKRVGDRKMVAESAKKALSVMRSFVKHLYRLRLVPELPRNLGDDDIKVVRAAIETLTVPEVKALVEGATGQLRLQILLGLNCGMYAGDLSDLRDSEVDWDRGRVIRKRSKERDVEGAPVVNWLLWAPTVALLREHRSGGETVLRTRSGGLWCWERVGADGKVRSSDNVATNFKRLRSRLGAKLGKDILPFKHLRKTSATMLGSHPEFGRYAQHFLGQSPRSVADKHYVAPPQDRFDAAMSWLGRQFGL